MIAIAMFGIVDPLRPGIEDAVLKCNKCGINVRMCTGDNEVTAAAISRKAKILKDDTKMTKFTVMVGEDFRREVGGFHEFEDPKEKLSDKDRAEGKQPKIIREVKNFNKF
jgi:magnesium-transporting ATPase (P-type)